MVVAASDISDLDSSIPVDAPIAPMSIAGSAITRHPKAARNDSTWAYIADEEERTR